MTFDLAPLDPARDLVAYLCAEFGVAEQLPLYAGGLGVLAGDHLKTASDLGVPLVAIGLLYRDGYFRQHLDAHGQQHADPDPLDPAAHQLELMRNVLGAELRIAVPLADHVLQVRMWRAQVGRVPLFLLDTDCPENSPEDRRITARLYGGNEDTRLLQEIVLGVGAVRAIRGLGLRPTVWHLNEGHAAFAGFERIRELVATGMSFSSALEMVAASTVFTTHTPVPAGHDVFSHGALHHWLGDYFGSLHTTGRRLLALGTNHEGPHRFSMTAFAMRVSRFRNAVSRIHRDVAARMEAYVWPRVPPEENPMQYVTNAVHLPTFLAPEWSSRLDHAAPDWRTGELAPADLEWIAALSDDEFRELRGAGRQRLLADLRQRLIAQHKRNGLPADLMAQSIRLLEPRLDRTLIIGFARRFATYKRATILLSDPGRLARLLGDPQRPVLLVFAGKAHPHDGGGQALIRTLHEHSLKPAFIGRLVVVEGYDIGFARLLVQGCDVWLNTPEYPLEASGTSGMKAAINGGVNLSILDGWWAEGFDGTNGFGIAPRTELADGGERYGAEASALFETLEREVLPRWFDDPPRWLALARASMRTLLPQFGTARMMGDYVRRLYGPAARQGERMQGRHSRATIEFVRWKKLVHAQAPGLRLDLVSRGPLVASVQLNGLLAKDFIVEFHGSGETRPLDLRNSGRDSADYVLAGPLPGPGRVRIVPVHPLLSHRFELGILADAEVTA